MIATIISGFLVFYSVLKTIYIAKTKKDGKILTYSIDVLSEKDAREFMNFITNLLTTLTIFYGTGLYLINIYTEMGLYFGIGFLVLTIVQDIYFMRVLFPREYKRIRGAKSWK